MLIDNMLNLYINLCAFVAVVMLMIAVILGGNLKERVFRFFFYLILLSFAGILNEFIIWKLLGTPGYLPYLLIRILDFISYAAGGMQIILMGLYIYEYLSIKTWVSKKLTYPFSGLGIIILLTVLLAQFNKMFAWVDEHNYYHVGEMVWIYQVLSLLAAFSLIFITLHYRKLLAAREWISLLLYPVAPIICYIIEVIYPNVWISQAGIILTLFIIYVNNQIELKVKMKEQEAELAEKRIAVMLSQIQPHFLYNSLSAIDRLCYDNPKAHQALLTFSNYLRGNMDSLSQKKLISFDKELTHTRQYLWLEELRFEEKLQVEYDIQVNEFMLPALTLQPIAENAVRYGITRKPGGVTIKIQTQKKENCFFITVADDGMGFDSELLVQDERSHTGIANVRARLAVMCRGQLSIESTPGKGTTVVIKIPEGGAR